MLTIRLQRTGRKHEPTFRVVLTDSRNGPKSGKYLEVLGWYDTRVDNKADQIDAERVRHWLSKGAQTSVTVHNFLVSRKVMEGKKLNALPRKSPIKKEEAAATPEASVAKAPESSATAAPEEKPVEA